MEYSFYIRKYIIFMNKHNNMTFLQHLEAFRWHLIRVILYVFSFSIICFLDPFKSFIFDKILFAPIYPDFFTYDFLCSVSNNLGLNKSLCFSESNFSVLNYHMSGQFTMHLYITLIFGFILSFPFIIIEVWRFIKPALYSKEVKYSKFFIFFSSFFFFTGLIFAYYIIAPLSLQFLGSYQVSDSVPNTINLSSFMKTLCSICICVGVIFELPILIYFLNKFNLVSIQTFKKYRKHIIVIILILSAIITPPDLISQILVTLPVLALYEFSLIAVKFINKET
tara:strand:+ start:1707 stop:2546 length:840 start_codon:yes stop_codon:yes gene_type:complete